jgi:methionyl-tRNA formyltransferase
MRLVFLGTPAFAVPTLERVLEAGHRVAAVYTQPDRPKGRGGQLAVSPVKEAALRLGLPVRQPARIRRSEVLDELRALDAAAMVVVGYGQIIPQSIIDLPRFGIINVHGSLLPKYRGAAPLQWAIASGEPVSGVTTMRIDAGLDTGDMLLKFETPIGPEETAIQLGARLARAGADLLVQTLSGIENGTIVPTPQNDAEATLAPILVKEDGRIDWNWPASKIDCRIRGFQPWPGAFTAFRGQLLHIWKARPLAADSGPPGRLLTRGKLVVVACGEGTSLELEEVQLEGRKRVPAQAFANGYRLTESEVLGSETGV